MGKLIIIESGSDASGKATQAKKIYDRLVSEGYNVKKVEYPNYESDSSALIKMYLNGDFGTDANEVDPYIASTFYTVDRYASYKTEWEEFYKSGGIIIADRYTTSNMVHQASKIDDREKREKYLNWLYEFEFTMYKLPKPDRVIFLDMPPQYSQELMKNRKNKITGADEKDIHEGNKEYLVKSYNNSIELVDRYGWKRISCVKEGNIKAIEEINQEIYENIKDTLNND